MTEINHAAEDHDKPDQQGHQLKGAFVSVMIVGGFILGCWLFVFFLFLIRNGG